MHEGGAKLLLAFVCRAVVAALAVAGAPAAPAQPVVPRPRINIPPPLPATSPVFCPPDSADKAPPCPVQPTFPPLTPAPLPVPKPLVPAVPATPATALSATPARGVAALDGDKVLSYFQRGLTRIDTRKAFGFVLIPKSAVTAQDKAVRKRFCEIMLASLEFATPGEAERENALATFWPIAPTRSAREIEAAFQAHDCGLLIAWYDHNLARRIAARAGVADLSGPLLITWPSEDANHPQDRNPFVVDFAKADHAHATKALTYWFRELRREPQAWTSRIREGTIRDGLAEAINDTAGVVVALLAGKWASVAAVNETP